MLASLAAAQERGRLVRRGGQWRIEAPPAPAVAGGALPHTIGLPLLVASGAPAALQFFGRAGQGRIGPALSFDYGITALEYEVRVSGAAGHSYREQWSLDALRQPQLDITSVVPGSPALLSNAIQFSTGGPLPRGVYRVLVLIAEFVAADASVQIA
jgi:hypothetical protein